MEPGTSLRAEDEVARSQLLFAVLVPEDGTTAEDEEHLFGPEVHMQPRVRRVGGQLVQRCSHLGVVRPPKDSMPGASFFVVSVPGVGEQVLASHSVYLQVVAVARSIRGRVGAASALRQSRAAGAASDRYLVAGSTAGS